MGFFDFLNPPAANVQLPAPQTTQGVDQTQGNVLGGIGNLGNFNTAGSTLGQYGGITQNLVNNPYANQFIGGAGVGGGMGQQAALNQFGQGGNLYGMAGSLYNTGFDPQQDLYNRTVQQLQDQTRAGEGARGIASSPYGAGLENTNLRNFNIDWQNQQLQRQMQGATGAASLIGQGANLQTGAPSLYGQSSAMPYNAYQQVGQGQLGALGQYGQFGQSASQLPQQQIQDWQNYLGYGAQNAGLNNQTAQLGLNQANLGFNQQQQMFSGLGQAAGAIAPFLFSDVRVKTDISPVGELFDRTPVYAFRYKGDATPRIGLMAQDVERRRPDAVVDVGGVKAVDYGRATELSRGMAAFSAWG